MKSTLTMFIIFFVCLSVSLFVWLVVFALFHHHRHLRSYKNNSTNLGLLCETELFLSNYNEWSACKLAG